MVAKQESLVPAGNRRSQQPGSIRKIKGFSMPVEGCEGPLKNRSYFMILRVSILMYREPSDFLLPVFEYLLTQRINNELGTKADPENMLLFPDTGTDELPWYGLAGPSNR
jgi:hypothetical protein